ncbi:MAG: alpha/beta fold hydrolase [Bacteroidales bacterium]|nr:alpha/beta fold hydrolase [Bacteroidales bacterium]
MLYFLKLVLLFFLCNNLFVYNVFTQIYHYETGEIIPIAKNDTLLIKHGVFKGYDADYCTLIVKENRTKAHPRLINLPVIRVKSLSKTPLEPIFLLNGGPGKSNIWDDMFPEWLLSSHDIIMVGYRGIEGSVILDAPEIKSFLKKTYKPLSDNNYNNLKTLWLQVFERYNKENIDLSGYNLEEVVEDIESVRKFLKYDKINLFSFSYGTMLSQLYCLNYNEHLNKIVMNNARPLGYVNFESNIIESQLEYINNLGTQNSLCNKKSQDIKLLFENILNDIDKINTPHPIDTDKLKLIIFKKLNSVTNYNYIFESLLLANNGYYDNLYELESQFYDEFISDLVLGDCIMKRFSNYPVNNTTNNQKHNLGNELAKINNRYWNIINNEDINITVNSVYKINNCNIPSLFVSGSIDFSAPVEYVKNVLLPKFKNGKLVIINECGHQDIMTEQENAYKNLIINYFDNNIIDTSLFIYKPIDFCR